MLTKYGSWLSFQEPMAKMVCDDYLKRGHALRIAIGTLLILLLANGVDAENVIWDEASGSPLPFTWNQTNFDGFNVSGVGTENLTILQTNLGTGTGKTRTIRNWEDIAGAGLVYNTTRYFEEYEISKIENLTVKNALNRSATSPMPKISDTDIYTLTTNATACINMNMTHHLVVNATDINGTFNDSVSIPLTVLMRGDINSDCKIDLKDLLFLRRHLAILEPSINSFVPDIQPAEGDGNVDLKDLLFLRRYLAGLEPLI